MRLSELKAVHLAVCFWLFHAQAFHEPAVLLRADLPCFPAVSGPLIYAALQALIQKDKAVSLPVQRLDSVSFPPAKQKEGIGTWIQLKLLLYQCGEAVYSFPDISVTAGDVYTLCCCKVIQHGDESARTTARNVCSSAPAYT